MNYSKIITDIYYNIKKEYFEGEVASYIPELAKIDPNYFGVHISTINDYKFGIGDYQKRFSIQSISKIFLVSYAYVLFGERLWDRVGVEPSGNPFNSLLQLEIDKGKPRNPFINAGAIVICDILLSKLNNPREDFLHYLKAITKNKNISFNSKVAESEKNAGYVNVALCNFLKSFKNIENNPNDVLDFYFELCSIELSCEEMSDSFLFLMSEKYRKDNIELQLNNSQAKRIKAIMQTCGFYDESGDFAFRVGLPGKSGVGGGIIAICPNKYTLATFSPLLNKKGNSVKGVEFLERFTTATEVSIF